MTGFSGRATFEGKTADGPLWAATPRPARNRVLAAPATSDTAIPASAIKNGNLTFTTNPATLTAAATVSGATAGCPSANWTGVNPTLTLTSITLDIFQPVTTQSSTAPRRTRMG